jgi:hypothetical protein
MSISNGTFSAPVPADNTKEAWSSVVGFAAGAGVAAVINPPNPMSAFTLYNTTSNVLRGTIAFTAGTVSVGGAATQTFLVPASGTLSLDFQDHDGDNAIGQLMSIDSVTLLPVAVGAVTAEASTLIANAATIAGVALIDFTAA